MRVFKDHKIIISVLIAMFIPLSYFSFTIPIINTKATLQNLPIYIAGLMYGPLAGGLVGGIGMFISQMLQYGVEPLTIVWMMPQIILGVTVGIFSRLKILDVNNKKSFIIYMICFNLLVTICNTLALYIDAYVKGYNLYIVLIEIICRFLSSIIFALIYASIIPFIIRTLNKISQ